jgi:hypothetical protein
MRIKMTLEEIIEQLKGKEIQIFFKNLDLPLKGQLIEYDGEVLTIKDSFFVNYVLSSEISFIRLDSSNV